MHTVRHVWFAAMTACTLAAGCQQAPEQHGSTAASSEASVAPATAAAAAPSNTAETAPSASASVAAVPADPAPTTVQLDLGAMQWKDLKSGKNLELVDTALDACGLPGWHLPLPKGVVLAPLSPAKGKGCSAKNLPGPPGTQLMVVIGGPPLPHADIQKKKAVFFEAPDGYIAEMESQGTPSYYPRLDRPISGEATSCSSTYVDVDTARAAYTLCRKLDKQP